MLQQFSVIKIKKSEEEVLEQLLKIYDSFTILNEAILSSLQKLITGGTVLIVDVVKFLHHYLGDTELKVDNIDQHQCSSTSLLFLKCRPIKKNNR